MQFIFLNYPRNIVGNDEGIAFMSALVNTLYGFGEGGAGPDCLHRLKRAGGRNAGLIRNRMGLGWGEVS